MTEDNTEYIMRYLVAAVIAVTAISILFGFGADIGSGSAQVEHPGHDRHTLDSSLQEPPNEIDVLATRENALVLSGDPVEFDAPDEFADGSWTVCVTAALDEETNGDAAYDVFAHDSGSLILQYDSGDWAVYHEDGDQDAVASVPADDPWDLTPMCARYDEGAGELSIDADGESSGWVALDTGTAERNVSWEWHGRQDEVRLFGGPLSDDSVDGYVDDPVAPMPGEDRLARFMFNEGSGDSTAIYFMDEDADVSGAGWGEGVGNPREWFGLASAIDEGDDYVIHSEPFGISIVEGGYLDGAPVVFVDWGQGGFFPIDVIGLLTLLIALLLLVSIAIRVRDMTEGP